MSPHNNHPPISIFLDGSPNVGPSADDDARSVSSTNERPPITLQGLKDIPKKFMKLFPSFPIRVGSSDPLGGAGIKSAFKSASSGVASLLRRNKIQPLEDAKDGFRLRNGKLKGLWVTRDNLRRNTKAVIDTYCTVADEVFNHRVLEDDVRRNVKRLHSVTPENIVKTIRRLSPDADVKCGSVAVNDEKFYERVGRAKKVIVTINSKPPQTSTYNKMPDGSWTKDGVADPGPIDFIKKAVDDHGATSVGVVIVEGELEVPLIPPGKALTLQQMKDRADTLFSQKNYKDAELAYLQALAKYAPTTGKGKGMDTATEAHLLDRLALSQDENNKYYERNETLERLIVVNNDLFKTEQNDAAKMKCLARIAEAAALVGESYMLTDRSKANTYLNEAVKAMTRPEYALLKETETYAYVLRQKARLLEMKEGGATDAEQVKIDEWDKEAIEVILKLAEKETPIDDEAGGLKLKGDYLRKHRYHEEASTYYQEALEKIPADDLDRQYKWQREVYKFQLSVGKKAEARETDRKIIDTLSTLAESGGPNSRSAWQALQLRRVDTSRSLLREKENANEAMQYLIDVKKDFEAGANPEQSPVYLAALSLMGLAQGLGADLPEDAGNPQIDIFQSFSQLKQEDQRFFRELTAPVT